MPGLRGGFNIHCSEEIFSSKLTPPLLYRAPGHWHSSDGRCFLSDKPITSHCGRMTLVFLGAIYNHLQVRKSLRFQAWRSLSDSETLVEGLAQRGPAILLDLRGMFAIAAYDRDKQQLLLARDRLGIKPLYLCRQGQGLLFGSERSALPIPGLLGPQTISCILSFGHDCTPPRFLAPDTHGIVTLPAGMVVRINHSRPHDPVRYWPPQPRPDWTPLPIRDRRWARTFLRQQLNQVVAQHLSADGPVAFLLSSGVNSSVLAALACCQQPGRTNTVTVVLPGTPQYEINHARRFARYCDSNHQELVIEEQQALAWVKQGLAFLDAPTTDWITTYLISRAVADRCFKVALTGLGADALFGRHSSHRSLHWLQFLRWIPSSTRQRLLQVLRPELARKTCGLPSWDRWHLALSLHRLFSHQSLAESGVDALQWPESAPQRITQARGQTIWAELFGSIEPMPLRVADQMGRACGLELRVPYLDHQLVEIALRMPQRFLYPDKGLLVEACHDLMPPDYINLPRQSFVLPMADWMRGPLLELCHSRLGALHQSSWLDSAWITQQWQAFEAGELNWKKVWSLVVLGEFASRDLPI